MANQFAAEESEGSATSDGYAAAVEELESILEDLEKDDVDIDDLARKVGRAEELLRFCEERLSHTEIQVKQIVANLETELPGNPGESLESPESQRTKAKTRPRGRQLQDDD